MDLIVNTAADNAALQDILANSYGAVSIGLVHADLDWSPALTLDDCTAAEGGYAGYARQLLVWQAPSLDDSGGIQSLAETLHFAPTGSDSATTIFGMFGVGGDATAPLTFVARFDDAPVPMADILDSIDLAVAARPRTGGVAVDVVS